MRTYLSIAVGSLAILAVNPAFVMAGQAFLPSQKAAAILADGRSWSAATPDGKTLTFTLKKDGTGSIKSPLPFTLSVTWKVSGDAMCITGKIGTKCLRFRVVPGGLQGWDGDKPDLKFSR